MQGMHPTACYGSSLPGEPLQTVVYQRDRLGRITQKDSHWAGSSKSTSSRYFYDKLNRLTRAFNDHSEIRLSYNADGLLAKEQFRNLREPMRPGTLQPHHPEGEKVTEYRYDVLGNRIQTILPTGETLNYLYYGSGHLHHINIDGETLSDIERDDLHRPASRSAGKLHSRFELDPLGRLKQQLAELQPEHHPEVLIGRRYQYDKVGNLTHTEDQRNGVKDYAYDPLGRITAAGDERFAFDPAHNIIDRGRKVSGNRLTDYNGTRYVYDGLGNLSETHRDNESQYYRYDADNQLIEARTERNGRPAEVWRYRYDALGRRISKETLNRKTEFIWEGSRLLQEYAPNGVYSYVYTEQGSYEPLAQIFKAEGATQSEVLYYHNDQIGIPRELTDEEGNIVWSGEYSGWGRLTNADTACLKKGVHQPFRLQNQYADEETGLYYNFFRYYDPHCGRFTQQDPIGLAGGESLYAYTPNVTAWVDFLGLTCKPVDSKGVHAVASYIVGQSGNAISAAGGITQPVRHSPAPARITGGWGSLSRILGSFFGLGTSLADPTVAEGGANMAFDIQARKCYEAGKCNETQWLQLKQMYNDCPRDAWAELNRIKGKK